MCSVSRIFHKYGSGDQSDRCRTLLNLLTMTFRCLLAVLALMGAQSTMAQLTPFATLLDVKHTERYPLFAHLINNDSVIIQVFDPGVAEARSIMFSLSDGSIVANELRRDETDPYLTFGVFEKPGSQQLLVVGADPPSPPSGFGYHTALYSMTRDKFKVTGMEIIPPLITYPNYDTAGTRAFNFYTLATSDTIYPLAFYETEGSDWGLHLRAVARDGGRRPDGALARYRRVAADSMRSNLISGAVSDTALYFTSTGQFVVDQYDLAGRYRTSFSTLANDDPEFVGPSFTGFYSQNAVAAFDNSLYYFGNTLLNSLRPTAEQRNAMHILRFAPDGTLLNSAVVDTQRSEHPGLQPLFLNRATSVSPNGEALWFMCTDNGKYPGEITWYVHGFGRDFRRRADVRLRYVEGVDSINALFDGVVALDDGGCLLYGVDRSRSPNRLLVYRLDGDGNAVSALLEPGADLPVLRFAFPNPVVAGAGLRIDARALPSETASVEAVDLLGRALGQVDGVARALGAGGGTVEVTLPGAAAQVRGPVVLIARDPRGRALGRQVILVQ